MPFISINHGGIDIACMLFKHEWSTQFSVQHRFPADVTQGISGRESRRPQDEALRFTATVHLILQDSEAQAFRNALSILGTGFMGVPLWPDALLGKDWEDRIYDPQVIIDLDNDLLLDIGDSLDDNTTYAPLLVGHVDSMPEIMALTDNLVELSFTITEDSPWDFRIGISNRLLVDWNFSDGTPADFSDGTPMTGDLTDVVPAGTWPNELRPNWVSSPLDKPTQGFQFNQVGEVRERTIENQEIPFVWGQEADFLLTNRNDIRTLLLFFLVSQGQRKPFNQPWWLAPGTPTPTAPASTVVRFADDTLLFDFETDGVVNCKVAVVQLPWEIEGVEGETPVQPGRVFLYQFKHALPDPQYYRYTNWPRPLTRSSDGTYAPAPMAHEKIVDGIDMKNETVAIDSFVFAGNPLMQFVPFIGEARMWLSIFEISSDPVDPNTAVLRWYGEVRSVQQIGRKITATAVFLGSLMDRQIPNVLIGPTCNTYLYSPRCGLNKADFQKSGTLTTSSGNMLTIATDATDADNIFAHGWIEVGSGATWELRAIIGSTPVDGGQQLVIDWPLRQAAASQGVVFYRGCDLTAASCTSLGNFPNFRGHPCLPLINLSLPSLSPPQGGGKK